MKKTISVRGARQNNLQGIDIDIPLNQLTVVTGVSGSGKSSLAFDTIYAEGQRRYVETFSAYARQFLDRMDRPAVDRIDGIPPAIAIQQLNPVRTSRSTVGTMTELNDHLKLLYAKAATPFCPACGTHVKRDSPESAYHALLKGALREQRVLICFRVTIPENFHPEEVRDALNQQGYRRVYDGWEPGTLVVLQDRLDISTKRKSRIIEAIESAYTHGHGHVDILQWDLQGELPLPAASFSAELHCAGCDVALRDATPNLFSFNSPLGACDTCRGFGRVIGVDYGLVIPDESLSLAGGAIKPWQTKSYAECQQELMHFAKQRKIPTTRPWRELSDAQRNWVLEGEGEWEDGVWYGVSRFFTWLESKAYKMHIRVLLSKYREYRTCTACHGARLKPEALVWQIEAPDGRRLNIHELMLLPIDEALAFCRAVAASPDLNEAGKRIMEEITCRLQYLCEVGLGYLTLDRQSRTLSGGEVQRINLTTALGSNMVNALFVLDEPSIGLHPRDVDRLVGVLHRLRNAGNTLLVVEHDPGVITAADHVVELGPGPGEHGGEIVFEGTVAELRQAKHSRTAPYLQGHGALPDRTHLPPPRGTCSLTIHNATQHNLKGIDVSVPLDRLVVVTGVSGSGKSTLIQNVLHHGLARHFGHPEGEPGTCDRIDGAQWLHDVVMVDQSPIGKTARANPGSYAGTFTAIREIFAREPLARERGYTASSFSFNSSDMRCPTCEGTGFEHVEMQFLSDVYIRCPDCDGTRFRKPILDVAITRGGRSFTIADTMELTITEASRLFFDEPRVLKSIRPLCDVGLGYLRLGQPVPTLSGGEAQRLKLAKFFMKTGAGRRKTKPLLFLLDEPTTGLHFEDVNVLLRVLERLVRQGHAVVVIEHNLDVVAAADWLIDLGPEGGHAGGSLVACGPPEQVMTCQTSHTGQQLQNYIRNARTPTRTLAAESSVPYETQERRLPQAIQIARAREHNLKELSLDLPRNAFTVVTGVSGSGKSTLAFDILFAEGQRRYLECLNAYARQFVQPAGRPDMDALSGMPPSVAIEQRLSRGGHKSTVATVTEIYHFLRLLFVKLGTQYCPDCDVPIESRHRNSIVDEILQNHNGKRVSILAPLVFARKGYYNDLARWAHDRGYPFLRVDGAYTSTEHWPKLDRFREHDIELPVAELQIKPSSQKRVEEAVDAALHHGKGLLQLVVGKAAPRIYSITRACPSCSRSFEELDPRLFSYNSRHGWCESCQGSGTISSKTRAGRGRRTSTDADEEKSCPACHGQRLNAVALAVRFAGLTIDQFSALSIQQARDLVEGLALEGRAAAIGQDLLAEICTRLHFLETVGLPYLTLGRAAPTLSGGEAQRIRLASQLGSNLRGVCYILDEPTIGLHPRDNDMLLDTLCELRDKGNTVVVVEHDEETMRRADNIIDLGPGAGVEGGELIAHGPLKEVLKSQRSLTAKFLRQPLAHPMRGAWRKTSVRATRKRDQPQPYLEVKGACLHNLRMIDVRIPFERLVVVTGVSGSGKSTLVRHVIHDNLQRILATGKAKATGKPHGCRSISGHESVKRIIEVDQTPIGRTPRSCPATYVGFWTDIRSLFAATPDAKVRGYDVSRFSFNTGHGRCATCDGQGVRRIEMSFLPDVEVLCESCNGARFNEETLEILWNGKNIAEVLDMNVDAAVDFFTAHSQIHHSLRLMQDVGLGYLALGQRSSTLSGGEAQRIKLVSELSRCKPGSANAGGSLYVLDEPTVGLHMADVERLIDVLHRLVDAGNTVLVIEHNLDIIAEADWILDLGPEGGDEGGQIVAKGAPHTIASSDSHTARFLLRQLAEHSR
jgi:excinuclease ABC subunit A